jgi:hypothetical protein
MTSTQKKDIHRLGIGSSVFAALVIIRSDFYFWKIIIAIAALILINRIVVWWNYSKEPYDIKMLAWRNSCLMAIVIVLLFYGLMRLVMPMLILHTQ